MNPTLRPFGLTRSRFTGEPVTPRVYLAEQPLGRAALHGEARLRRLIDNASIGESTLGRLVPLSVHVVHYWAKLIVVKHWMVHEEVNDVHPEVIVVQAISEARG